ncbi:MAG: tRNA-dihydrouridine synthase family protein [Candidatus Diapherotrites archaeon]|nr:tRNA-dihydrouridine synthase family protein [Candidatus Diapherotrites archaeon]
MQKIGSLRIEGEVLLAPMADYTNIAFRTLAKEYGAALTYTELISAKALTMKSKRTQQMLLVSEKEKPVFLQLFGSNPQDFKKAIRFVEEKYPMHFAGYDLNAGCSVPKALKGKYGCSLMNEPKLIGEIISAMKEELIRARSINLASEKKTASLKKPVTLKMRLGLKNENFLEIATLAEAAGVDAITLHPRLGKDGYSFDADWKKIKLLKENVKVPVIGNGDIKKASDALQMKKETGCDFVMIGRGAIGNAFIFKQVNSLFIGEEEPKRTLEEVFSEGKKFLSYAKEFNLKTNDIRPYFIGMSKGLIGATVLRNRFGLSKTIEEIEEFFYKYFEL